MNNTRVVSKVFLAILGAVVVVSRPDVALAYPEACYSISGSQYSDTLTTCLSYKAHPSSTTMVVKDYATIGHQCLNVTPVSQILFIPVRYDTEMTAFKNAGAITSFRNTVAAVNDCAPCGNALLDTGEQCDCGDGIQAPLRAGCTTYNGTACSTYGCGYCSVTCQNAGCAFSKLSCRGDGNLHATDICGNVEAAVWDDGTYNGNCNVSCKVNAAGVNDQCVNTPVICSGGDLWYQDQWGNPVQLYLSCNGYGCSGTSCNAYCGDGVRNGSEACEGSDLNGQTCVSQGFGGGGTLSCASNCTFNTSSCISCTANSYQSCSGDGNLHWFDSCGNDSGVVSTSCALSSVTGGTSGRCSGNSCCTLPARSTWTCANPFDYGGTSGYHFILGDNLQATDSCGNTVTAKYCPIVTNGLPYCGYDACPGVGQSGCIVSVSCTNVIFFNDVLLTDEFGGTAHTFCDTCTNGCRVDNIYPQYTCPAQPACEDGACNGTETAATCPCDCNRSALTPCCSGHETCADCDNSCTTCGTCPPDPSFSSD